MAKKYTRKDFEPLSKAEEMIFADGFDGKIDLARSLPHTTDADKTIRAALIRHLLLGELYREDTQITLPPAGLSVSGAFIKDSLDLEYCDNLPPLRLRYCRFEGEFSLIGSEFKLLNLNNSALDWKGHSFLADGAQIKGSVFMKGVEAKGTVRWLGAEIGGNLEMQNAKLFGKGDSFSADQAKIKGGVFMEELKAKGAVRWHGAEIGGHLGMQNAKLFGKGDSFSADQAKIKAGVFMEELKAKGAVRWRGAEIGGHLGMQNANCEGMVILQTAQIGGGCIFSKANFSGGFSGQESSLGVIVDDGTIWPEKGKLWLRGARYSGFQGASKIDAQSRLKWLDRIGDFHPQPYRQLAKVFRANGQERDANEVLYVMEKQISSVEWQDAYLNSDARRLWGQKQIPIVESFRYFIMLMFRVMTGFGYRLHYAMIWLVLAIGIGAIVAQQAFDNGQMVPNSDVILSSSHWIVMDDPQEWVSNTIEGKDWESFNSLAYAMDVYLPLVDFGQESTWAPSKDRGFWGWIVWWGRWIWKIAGWLLFSALIVSLSAMVERRYEK